MNAAEPPLDWWAVGGYPAIIRELDCSDVVARRRGSSKWHRGHSFSPPSRPREPPAPPLIPPAAVPAVGSLRCGYLGAS
jgi:hypothetical protein